MRELLGQPRLLERLGERAASGEATHAYLISGPRSIGKHTLALRLAQTLNCERSPQPGGCGACVACRKIERGTHPDVREIERPRDKRDIPIELVREMALDLSLRPLEGRWRVVVIDDAAELSEPAQHGLLKTLEEPPPRASLILVARSADALEPTIVSRCQPIVLRPLSPDRIVELVTARTADPELARRVAPLASGRPGLALRLAADERERRRREETLDELIGLVGKGLVERFGWARRTAERADRMSSDRERLQEALEEVDERFGLWLELIRDAAVAAARVRRLHPDRAARTERLGSALGHRELAELAGLLVRLRDDLHRNSNVRTALELFCLRLPYRSEFARAA